MFPQVSKNDHLKRRELLVSELPNGSRGVGPSDWEKENMTRIALQTGLTNATSREVADEIRHEKWVHWPVNWTAVWIGALSAFTIVLIIGLIAIAVGAHLLGPENRLVELRKTGILALLFSVFGAFISFAAGGWIAGKIAGVYHSEPAMLIGGVVWLVGVPLLLLASALGAGSLLGGWYAGLGSSSTTAPYVRPEPIGAGASAQEIAVHQAQVATYERNVEQWNQDTPKVVRNSALGAVTALLLGLVGSVIGGWAASGEPMNFKHHLTRKPVYYSP
jgi:hypothetical protein